MFELIIKDKIWYKYSARIRRILLYIDKTQYQNKFLEVVLTNDEEMYKMNLEYRKKDKPTNVISFTGEINIVFLGFNYIKAHCDPYKQFNKNIIYYLIHGILHTLGYDHETDEDWMKMSKMEECLLNDCIRI